MTKIADRIRVAEAKLRERRIKEVKEKLKEWEQKKKKNQEIYKSGAAKALMRKIAKRRMKK